MTKTIAIALSAASLSLFAAHAHAGSAGAGPGGNGAVAIGTVASSITFDRALAGVVLMENERRLLGSAADALAPGTFGQLLIDAERIEALFNQAAAANGSRVSEDGQVALVTVTLVGGRGASVMVNRGTRKVTLISRL